MEVTTHVRAEVTFMNRVPLMIVAIVLAFLTSAEAVAQPMLNVVHPLPPQAPAWLDGYAACWPVRVLGEPIAQTAQSVLVSIPNGGWLKADGSDIAVQSGAGKLLPVTVLAHDSAGDTIIQFQRHGNDPWYWVYGINPIAPPLAKIEPFREGLTLELRDWAGDDLSSWIKVRAGLEKSTSVIGNAIVTEVMQNTNPARPTTPTKFAASYRGYFNVKKEGTHTFVVNADDAAFLFIDGFKVFERPGVNRPLGAVKVKELEKIAGRVDLKPGVHSFEVHQAVGESPQSRGSCVLAWTTPEQPKFMFVPPTAIAHPLYARAAAVLRPDGNAAGAFTFGLDDMLESAGLKLFLVRFEADGDFPNADKLQWDFGDGTVGVGRSPTHIYFKEGDYQVTLNVGGGLPPFKRRVHVWPEPGDSSPLSLEAAVRTLERMDWKKLDVGRVREIFSFLRICEQANHWPLLDSVARHLLAQKDVDLETRSQYITARLEALTNQGKAAEALKLAEQSAGQFAKTPVLQVRLQLGVAAIHQYHYKDAAAASKIYKAILDEHKRVEHPNLRLAGVRWGDLFAEAGDLVRASDAYRVAATLGGDKFAGTASTEATTRGALMRIAEQKLKAGDFQATRQLLERMELEYPGRRLDGLYCFMRAETDRNIGRYEDALRNYEMIFRLPQWAGYRDRATLGMADSYFRMGDYEKSLKWYKNLKETYPKYHEEKKCDVVEKLIADRLQRIKNARTPADAFFKGFVTGFEPTESEWFGQGDFAIVRAPGLQGPHAALLDAYPRELATFEYHRPLTNLTPGGTYWVEIWYRDIIAPAPPLAHQQPFIQCRLSVEGTKTEVLAPGMNLYRTSHHHWHKLSCKIKAPMAQDCLLKLTFANHTGAYLYDALSIRSVSDRQLDSLANFLEGGKTP
jgi:tetratricopeptide (TPR) repeat protein